MAEVVTIAGCVLGGSYILTEQFPTRTAQAQQMEQPDALTERIHNLMNLETREIFGNHFTRVHYNTNSETDNLFEILKQEKTPAIVYFLEEDETAVGGKASKKQAVVLRIIAESTNLPIRFIEFSYNDLAGSENERLFYLNSTHQIKGIPSTRLYVPRSSEGSEFNILDTQKGGVAKVDAIKRQSVELPEYWLQPNLFSSGERTIYRFGDTFTWNEYRADGRGNILDSDGHIAGQDVDPALVRLWTEGRALRTERGR